VCEDVGHKRFACPHKGQGGPDGDVAPVVGVSVAAAAADAGAVAGLLCEDSDSDRDREDQSHPEKQQAPGAPEKLSSSQALSVDTEAGS